MTYTNVKSARAVETKEELLGDMTTLYFHCPDAEVRYDGTFIILYHHSDRLTHFNHIITATI